MATLEDLKLQKADIDEKIRVAKETGKAKALSSVLTLIQDYDLTFEDLQAVLQEPKQRKKSDASTERVQNSGGKKRGRPRKIQTVEEVQPE